MEVRRIQVGVIRRVDKWRIELTLCAVRLPLCGTLVQNGVSEGNRTLDLRGHNPVL